jgi:hypothetical protein
MRSVLGFKVRLLWRVLFDWRATIKDADLAALSLLSGKMAYPIKELHLDIVKEDPKRNFAQRWRR